MANNTTPDFVTSNFKQQDNASHQLSSKKSGRNVCPASSKLKRQFDIFGAVIGIILFAPLMIGIALAIMTQGGSAFFQHRRVGRNGHPFDCLKFRTMVPDANEKLAELLATDPAARRQWETAQKLVSDPRITPLGKFLRLTSLDELPQFFNVLKGEMSLIGPRPITNDEVPRYGPLFADYANCRPGMSGMWQVSGRNKLDYQSRVQLDSNYAKNWNLWLDIKILLRTFGVLLNPNGN